MKYIADSEVSEILEGRWDEIIEYIEEAFIDKSSDMVPKIYLDVHNDGDFRAMPSAFAEYACLKWIGVFPRNREIGQPTTIGSLLLNCRNSGKPLMAMDCSTLTAYRTAATSAIAAKYCAPNDLREVAFVGCGKQAYYHFLAYKSIFPDEIQAVSLYDTNEDAVAALSKKIKKHKVNVFNYVDNVSQAISKAGIITTLTPSRKPFIKLKDVPNNCHINAVGADAVGKRELCSEVISECDNILCDDPIQALHSGELQYSDEWGHIFEGCSTITSLKEVIENPEKHDFNESLSIFDSTGVAIEDIATAILVYRLYNSIRV